MRRREQLDALEEERPLLGEEEGEALVGRDLRHVRLDLREVGVDRGVERRVGGRASTSRRGRRRPRRSSVVERRCRAPPLGRADLAGGRRTAPPPGGRRGQALRARSSVLRVADEAVAAARQARPRTSGSGSRAGSCGRAGCPRSAGRPSGSAATRTGCASRASSRSSVMRAAESQKKSGELSSPDGVVGHRVVLDAARVGEEHLRRLAVVAGVEDDAAVVGRSRRRCRGRRRGARIVAGLGVVELEGGVEEAGRRRRGSRRCATLGSTLSPGLVSNQVSTRAAPCQPASSSSPSTTIAPAARRMVERRAAGAPVGGGGASWAQDGGGGEERSEGEARGRRPGTPVSGGMPLTDEEKGEKFAPRRPC